MREGERGNVLGKAGGREEGGRRERRSWDHLLIGSAVSKYFYLDLVSLLDDLSSVTPRSPSSSIPFLRPATSNDLNELVGYELQLNKFKIANKEGGGG